MPNSVEAAPEPIAPAMHLAPMAKRKLLEAAEGTSFDAFTARDWAALLGIAVIWGSSFLLISIGLGTDTAPRFAPGVVALLRVLLGAATLALFPKARKKITDRSDRVRIFALGWIWIGVPFLLFPFAQQHVDSSVAGMINGGVPLTAALWGTLLLRRLPARTQAVGIALGFVGIVGVAYPSLGGSSATAFGAMLLLIAIFMYGLSNQLVVPLQQKYGGLAVILRAQLSALVLIAPVGLWQLSDSTFAWGSLLAMVPLGVLGTGIALVMIADLIGRVGGARGSVAIYLVPIVSIVLGVTLNSETVQPIAYAGMGLVLLGAWLTSRAVKR
jgi:drug/metabolite transporter (DMT)-like permease